jgi:hypothetical protein
MHQGLTNLETHLERFRLTPDDLYDYIHTFLRLTANDVVFAGGSVIDGVANDKSDIDLFLITARTDFAFTSLNDIFANLSGCNLDIRIIHSSKLEQLLEKFESWESEPRLAREAFRFTEDERKLLHRLCTGVAISNQQYFTNLQARASIRQLAKHKLDWAIHLAHCIQVDLEGLRLAGDYHSMAIAAQELLGHVFDALLAINLNTCPNRKWRVRYISKLPTDWHCMLPLAHQHGTAIDRFMKMHRAPIGNKPNNFLEHALTITDFSRAILPRAENLFLSNCKQFWPLVSKYEATSLPTNGLSLPSLGLDVCIYFNHAGFQLTRLNSGTPPIGISEALYETLCFFNGTYSRSYVISMIQQSFQNLDAVAIVDGAISLTKLAKLKAAPMVTSSLEISQLINKTESA